MKNHLIGILLCAGALALVGCGMGTSDTPAPQPGEPGAETGIAMTIDLGSAEDIEAFRFHIDTCDGEEVVTEVVEISELELGEIEGLEIDGEGVLRFADFFAVVEAGCYDVEVQALDAEGNDVEECAPAVAQGVQVHAGETTEIVMVSQCGGDHFGGLDILGVLNFAPTITVLQFDPSKIVGCDSVEVCVTAVDSDGDGIEFEWSQLDGPTPAVGPVVMSSDEEDGVFTECVEMTPQITGSYSFRVTAFDMMEDADGDLVRVEDLVGEQAPEFTSRSSLNFPLHVVCEDPPEDVLEEIEDKPKKTPEDVLEEIEDEPKEVPEDVLEEIEDEAKEVPEDVLEEIEDEAKHLPEDVLEEIEEVGKERPEGVLDEIEEDFRKGVLGEVEECTFPVEFWRAHHRFADDEDRRVAWPADEETLLRGETWLSIVQSQADKTRAWTQLAQQFVAALLNIKSGAEAPKGVLLVLEEAEELLEEGELQGAARIRAKDLKSILFFYNRGVIGPGPCPNDF